MSRVAVVTGSNKGIGLAIVAGLCRKFDGDVYLTSRDVQRGEEAVAKLQEDGLNPKFHQLDICDLASVCALKQHIQNQYGGLDVLINNAAISYGERPDAPRLEKCEVTIDVNFFGTVQVCKELFPILKPGARVVHLSSMGFRRALGRCSVELQNKLKACATVEEVGQYMAECVSTVKAGTQEEAGWPVIKDDEPAVSMAPTAYGLSKTGVSLITPIQQQLMDTERPGEDIVINSCCPGRVRTQMSGWQGDKTVEEGAASPIHLALLPANVASPRGEFMREIEIFPWK